MSYAASSVWGNKIIGQSFRVLSAATMDVGFCTAWSLFDHGVVLLEEIASSWFWHEELWVGSMLRSSFLELEKSHWWFASIAVRQKHGGMKKRVYIYIYIELAK